MLSRGMQVFKNVGACDKGYYVIFLCLCLQTMLSAIIRCHLCQEPLGAATVQINRT